KWVVLGGSGVDPPPPVRTDISIGVADCVGRAGDCREISDGPRATEQAKLADVIVSAPIYDGVRAIGAYVGRRISRRSWRPRGRRQVACGPRLTSEKQL